MRNKHIRLLLLFLISLVSINAIKLGSDRLDEKKYSEWIKGKRVGLITNATGLDSKLRLTSDQLVARTDLQLVALFGPEHGIAGAAQAGDQIVSTRSVYSLYGETKAPTPEMLANVDVLLFDIQDVGVRFYTYLSTMFECMKSAAANGKPFIVLDRPNPINAKRVEGPMLEPGNESFVGIFPIPIRHGMTVGELAQFFNAEAKINCDLKVVPLKGWKRSKWYDKLDLEWVIPSPNMPTLTTAILYPGTCLIEGTNLSEGRGTTKPFELVGAPWLDSEKVCKALNALRLPGVYFRPQAFTPWFSKHKDEVCQGIQVHIMDRDKLRPIEATLHLIAEVKRTHPDRFEFIKSFDRLAGTPSLREGLEKGESVQELLGRWEAGLDRFQTIRKKHLLYR